jgi:hypothetical protein
MIEIKAAVKRSFSRNLDADSQPVITSLNSVKSIIKLRLRANEPFGTLGDLSRRNEIVK